MQTRPIHNGAAPGRTISWVMPYDKGSKVYGAAVNIGKTPELEGLYRYCAVTIRTLLLHDSFASSFLGGEGPRITELCRFINGSGIPAAGTLWGNLNEAAKRAYLLG